MDQILNIGRIVENIRDLQKSNRESVMPVSLVRGNVHHQPVDPMVFRKGKWSNTPWRGVMCMGLQLTNKRVMVLCQVSGPIRLDPQEHGPWSERLIMLEGELYEHTTGETYKPGDGVFYKPHGVVHEPEFKMPSVCVITWEK